MNEKWVCFVAKTLIAVLVCYGLSRMRPAFAESGGKIVVAPLAFENSPAACSYGFCKSFSAAPNVQVIAVATWYLNDCQSLGTGGYSVITNPMYGTWSQSGVVNITPPGCSSPLPANLAFYTWTASSDAATDDNFALQYTVNGGSPSESIGLDAQVQQPPPIVLGDFLKECKDVVDNALALHIVTDDLGNALARPMASFSPVGGLQAAAQICKFDDFGWEQIVTVLPTGYVVRNGNSVVAPHIDGFPGQEPFYYGLTLDSTSPYSLAWNKRNDISHCPHGNFTYPGTQGDAVLCYTDHPTISVSANLGAYEQFTTSLVGVKTDKDGKKVRTAPLAQWIWIDAFYQPSIPVPCTKQYIGDWWTDWFTYLGYIACKRKGGSDYSGQIYIVNKSSNINTN